MAWDEQRYGTLPGKADGSSRVTDVERNPDRRPSDSLLWLEEQQPKKHKTYMAVELLEVHGVGAIALRETYDSDGWHLLGAFICTDEQIRRGNL